MSKFFHKLRSLMRGVEVYTARWSVPRLYQWDYEDSLGYKAKITFLTWDGRADDGRNVDHPSEERWDYIPSELGEAVILPFEISWQLDVGQEWLPLDVEWYLDDYSQEGELEIKCYPEKPHRVRGWVSPDQGSCSRRAVRVDAYEPQKLCGYVVYRQVVRGPKYPTGMPIKPPTMWGDDGPNVGLVLRLSRPRRFGENRMNTLWILNEGGVWRLVPYHVTAGDERFLRVKLKNGSHK